MLLKVTVSPVSVEGPARIFAAELPGWDFDATAAAAGKAWNDELGKVRIETTDDTARKIFYTALYHAMIAPVSFCDVDGAYRGADGEVHADPGHAAYTVFSLWDTYRAKMPLLTLTQPERMTGIVGTMLDIADEQGVCPYGTCVGQRDRLHGGQSRHRGGGRRHRQEYPRHRPRSGLSRLSAALP